MAYQDWPPSSPLELFFELEPELDPESELPESSLSSFALAFSTSHVSANQFWISISVFSVSPSGQMSSHTPLVPERKGATALCLQKQASSTAGTTGGTQAPLASRRGPQSDAQSGRSAKGIIVVSGWAAVG